MITRIQLLAIITSLGLISIVIELIRRRRLEEKYAISWLLTSFLFLVCSIKTDVAHYFSKLIGVVTPSNFLFLLAFFLLVGICLSLTVVVSDEAQKSRKLAQELSILKFYLEEMKRKMREAEEVSRRGEKVL